MKKVLDKWFLMCYNGIVKVRNFKNGLTKPQVRWYNISKENRWIKNKSAWKQWKELKRLLSKKLESPGVQVRKRQFKKEESLRLIFTRSGISYVNLKQWRDGLRNMGFLQVARQES